MSEYLSQHLIQFASFTLYSLFELWLGKTDKTNANSTWELIGKIVASAAKKVFTKKEGQ